MSPVLELSEGGSRWKDRNGAGKEGGEEQGDDVIGPLLVFFHGVISDQSRDKTLKISQKAGRRALVLIYVDTRTQSWVLIIYLRGAHQHLIHFVGLLHFSVFVCVPLGKKRLFAQELYLHSQALFGRTKLIPGLFLGRVHQLSHSPQTLCTQRDHSRGPLLRCSAPQ